MKLIHNRGARALRAAVAAGACALLSPVAMAQLWTHVAAACVPDESSQSKFEANAARFRHKGTNSGAIYARCNVTNPLDSGANPGWNAMELVFKDQGDGARVRAQLYRVSNSNGGVWLIGTVDSDTYAGSAGQQTQWDWLVTTSFDFYKYAYYVMLTIERNGTDVQPDAAIVRLFYMLY